MKDSVMGDSQYAPLTTSLVRNLTDKVYEKRKIAALEIQKQVQDLHQANHLTQLEKLLGVLKDLVMTPNGNARKGGVIALAAAAIGLGKNSSNYTRQLIEPILPCFIDPDPRVRYFACEALYNVVKMCRSSSIVYFNQLFDVLWRLSADTDQNVRSGAELIDRLLKDIVLASKAFDDANFMTLIRERIYVQNSSNRKFIVQWLSVILSSPAISILPYLPEVLDGLLQIIDDSQPGVRDSTEDVLGKYLSKIRNAHYKDEINISNMINVLIAHTSEDSSILRRTIALIWLEEFIELHGMKLLPHMPSYLNAVLPYLNDQQLRAKEINALLMENFTDHVQVDVDGIINVLLKHIKYNAKETRFAVLNWINHMHHKAPNKIFIHMDRIFPILLSMLSDACDDILLLDLQLLSDICEVKIDKEVELKNLDLDDVTKSQLLGISPYLIKFTISLLVMFKNDNSLLNERGILIIRQLCLLLDSAHIYRCISVLLLKEENVEFVSKMVTLLNGILLTTTELFELRNQLKSLATEDYLSLFKCLYRCWCYQPIALLGLCILSQNYDHASQLACHLCELDVTVDILVEIDRLVQLIESPIFAYVRLDLLHLQHQPSLASVLSALLMLLPQTDSYNILFKRLQSVPLVIPFKGKNVSRHFQIDFEPLFEHFLDVIKKKRCNMREKHRGLLKATTSST